VSDCFTVWKSEGVLAAWIYLFYHSLALTKGRWFLSAPQNSVRASKDAEAKTRQWLIRHEFPEELCQAFGGQRSSCWFGSVRYGYAPIWGTTNAPPWVFVGAPPTTR